MQVLMYNIDGGKAVKIKQLCRMLNADYRVVEPSEYGLRLDYLLGLSEDGSVGEGSVFSEEMLYFAGFYGAMLNIFLNQLKKQRATVALKAVMTETNVGFTSFELFGELSREHEALNGGKQ